MIPLRIVCRDFKITGAIRAEIREYTEKTRNFFPRLIACEVVVSAPHQHRRKGNIYHVAIRLKVPGPDIVVNREAEQEQPA